MKLAIIDPGYVHPDAHHQSVNMEIAYAFAKTGIQTVIFSSKRIEQKCIHEARTNGVELIPYFKTPCYILGEGKLAQDQRRVSADSFFLEIFELLKSPLMDDVVSLYFHTGFGFHLLGLARALKSVNGKTLENFIITLMFNPGARIQHDVMDIWDLKEYFRYLMAFNNLAEASKQNGLKIKVATSCRSYQKIYEQLWSFTPVEIHPAINQVTAFNSRLELSGRNRRVLLYLGGPKEDKGIEFSAKLCQLAAKKFPDFEFIFHYNPDYPDARDRFLASMDELRAVSRNQSNIIFTEGFLEMDSYQILLGSCEFVALLYDPKEYKFKTSGVFWDALKFKKQKWLVSKDTWIANELSELGISYLSTDYGDLPKALLSLEKLLVEDPQDKENRSLKNSTDSEYFNLLTSSFTDWLLSRVLSV